MRKLIWGVAACGVALAGGLLGGAYLAAGNPTSLAARCLTGISRMTVLLNPTTGIAPVLAEKVWHNGTSRGCEDLQECGGPEEFADPVPVEDPAPAPEPVET